MAREIVFLVRGVCDCGWECACLEGSRWPVCPECGELVLPPRPPGVGDHGDREGYIALRLPEGEALEPIQALLRQGREQQALGFGL